MKVSKLCNNTPIEYTIHPTTLYNKSQISTFYIDDKFLSRHALIIGLLCSSDTVYSLILSYSFRFRFHFSQCKICPHASLCYLHQYEKTSASNRHLSCTATAERPITPLGCEKPIRAHWHLALEFGLFLPIHCELH